MLQVLVESRRARQRWSGGALFSVVVHAALIVTLAAVTIRAAPTPAPADAEDTVIMFPPLPAKPQPTVPRRPGGRTTADEKETPLPGPVVRAPDIDLPATPTSFDSITFGRCDAMCASGGQSSDSGGHGDPGDSDAHFEWMVDVPAVARAGNPAPVYPRMLREANIEGAVLAQFVIDTTGRVDGSTFRVLASTHSSFERSVRDAVARMRFTPARSGGRRVRVLVQQRFAFRLAR